MANIRFQKISSFQNGKFEKYLCLDDDKVIGNLTFRQVRSIRYKEGILCGYNLDVERDDNIFLCKNKDEVADFISKRIK